MTCSKFLSVIKFGTRGKWLDERGSRGQHESLCVGFENIVPAQTIMLRRTTATMSRSSLSLGHGPDAPDACAVRSTSPRRASFVLALQSRLVLVLGALALLGGASTPVQARQAVALGHASSSACVATCVCAYLRFACAKSITKKKKAGGTRSIGACREIHVVKDAMAAAERFAAEGERGHERECWVRAAELDDENPEPLTRLGNMAHLDGKLQTARTLLEQALAMAPASANVHSSIASVEYSLGGPHFTLAVRHYQAQIFKRHLLK